MCSVLKFCVLCFDDVVILCFVGFFVSLLLFVFALCCVFVFCFEKSFRQYVFGRCYLFSGPVDRLFKRPHFWDQLLENRQVFFFCNHDPRTKDERFYWTKGRFICVSALRR